MANRPRGALYLGVTNDLVRRIWEHREQITAGHTKRYNIKQLVWYEVFPDPDSAIATEKRIKKWRRAWKIELIENMNPTWKDLYFEIIK
ncbi:GIY-YIG nuclease family protein [Hyphobacterium sp.]|uniref:GIY-YIG nuclease family protein n=1 Tax=Hyphobacterium sp. TaxID=2004662 RepID=UPI003BAB59B2